MIYVKSGGEIGEVLESGIKEKVAKIVEKSVLSQATNFDLDKADLEQMQILKVQQKLDRDHALRAVEKDIEDTDELEKIRMEEALAAKQQK